MTNKINFNRLKDILCDAPEFLPYKIGIDNSIDTFLKIRETLTRIGRLQPKTESKNSLLYQVCHIVQDENDGSYYITHFKHLYLLNCENSKTEINEQDADQIRYIVHMLEKWGLCEVYEDLTDVNPRCNITVIPFSKKKEVTLRRKFNIRKG